METSHGGKNSSIDHNQNNNGVMGEPNELPPVKHPEKAFHAPGSSNTNKEGSTSSKLHMPGGNGIHHNRMGCSGGSDTPSIPTLKLVPALKSSREKLGIKPKKMNVTWASDVYDPPPTSLSHAGKYTNQKKSRRKRGKMKQKGDAEGSTVNRKKKKKKKPKYHSKASSSKVDPVVFDDVINGDLSRAESCSATRLLEKSLEEVHLSVAES